MKYPIPLSNYDLDDCTHYMEAISTECDMRLTLFAQLSYQHTVLITHAYDYQNNHRTSAQTVNIPIADTMVLLLVLLLAATSVFGGQVELLKNGDFEEEFGEDNWFCRGNCNLERSTDAYSGQYSGNVTGR